jgi:hypothetical protein
MIFATATPRNFSPVASIQGSPLSGSAMRRPGLRQTLIRTLPTRCRVKLRQSLTRRCRLRKVASPVRNRSCGSKFGSLQRFDTWLRYRLLLHIKQLRPRGGVVTQRSAKPFTPVQFRAWPPIFRTSFATVLSAKGSCFAPWRRLSKRDRLCYMRAFRRASRLFPGSSAVEQPAVNRLVAGSNPARGANCH